MSTTEKVRMGIYGLQYSQTQTGAYALILEEAEGSRRLPIIIGSAEAQAIAIILEDMKPTRPLTHDIFHSVAEHFGLDLTEVVVNDFKDGVFYAKLVFANGSDVLETDCRPSDAISLAIRFNCPIFTHEFILSAAAFEKDGNGSGIRPIANLTAESSASPVANSLYSAMTPEELRELLNDAIANEDYELASKIRDELNRRD
ncbi:MAG: bifunctional nuclease family protein [Flavobacteriales bacterium]|nr:bifunctional nuclease family protein [Flavobacteriales bacterium]